MKKHALALAATLAVSGTAFAQATVNMSVNNGGNGHQLVFPYYSAQGDGVANENVTLLTITNTDRTNGKLLKVRFRGASNSDDVLDFTLAMSPGDVWTGMVNKNADGGAQLTTYDTSCTIPDLGVGTPKAFVLDRVGGKSKASESLEGYAEVINMGDIPSTSPIYATIKHGSSGKPACSSTVFAAHLATRTSDLSNAALSAPTATLNGDWIILNQKKTAGWSGSATALVASEQTKVVFSPQLNNPLTKDLASTLTSDPAFTVGTLQAMDFDFPDLSTPYVVGSVTPIQQANAVSKALAVKKVANQYVTDSAIAAVTDMMFSQPTRRYHAAFDGTTARYATGSQYYTADNTVLDSKKGQICLSGNGTTKGIVWPSGNTAFADSTLFDREEYTPTPTPAGVTFVISPNTASPSKPLPDLCGEVAIMSVGAATGTSALTASLTRYDGTPPDAKLVNGWMEFAFAGIGGNGLPVIGSSFIRVANGAVNYGIRYDHKVTSK